MAETALLDGTVGGISSAAELLSRFPAAHDVHGLLTVALRHRTDEGIIDTSLLSAPFEDLRLERLRWDVLLGVLRGVGGAAYRSAVRDACAWAESGADDESWALAAWWRSSLNYQDGRHREAAVAAESGATMTSSVAIRARLTLRAMACWLELGEVERTLHLGEQLRTLGRRMRLPTVEAHGEWCPRVVGHRLRTVVEVDEELVAAVSHVGSPELAGLIWCTEATIGLRTGATDRAFALAEMARNAFTDAARPASACWAQAVALAARPDPAPAERCAAALVATQRHDIVAEGLALLARTNKISEQWRPVLDDARAKAGWGERLDWPRGILSPQEMVWPG